MNRKLALVAVLTFAAGTAVGSVWSAWSRPLGTPFDHIDEGKAAQYRSFYERGRDWSRGRHLICPPNPLDGEFDWIAEAWVAGFMAGRAQGGDSAIPERYEKMVPAEVPVERIRLIQ